MRVRFISALIAALTACVLLPAMSSAAPASQGCDASHHSDTGHGANQGGPYDNTCDGSPSGNGNGNGQATGKPCAGCVGNADDKNPGAASGKGQYPNGSDHNAGYECDRNHGIGRTNPAHTGCRTQTVTPQTCPNGSPMPPSGKCETGGSKCPNGSPMPPNGKCDTGTPNTCPNGSPMPSNGKCGENNGNKCPDGSQPVNGNCGSKTETPPSTTSTNQPPPGQAVLGERTAGSNTPASAPKSSTPSNGQQKVLGENASGVSPASSSPPASAQATQAEAANSKKPLPFTGTDLIVVLLAAGIALTGGVALRRLATHRA
jgi:hypothetical protein